ncbi:ABC transporter permease [soil metagenome]
MLRNYLKTAFRNLWRQKGNTTINLEGLTLGIASSLILFLMIRHMSSYDTYHSKGDRIYRVVTESDGNNGKDYTAGVPAIFQGAFRNDFPEAEEVTFTSYENGGLVTLPQPVGEPKKYQENHGIVYAQQNFFKIFDRKILRGDAAKALDEPNAAVLSQRLASKYFGDKDALGEVIKFANKDFKVSAIMEDFPNNTDFPFDLMLSYVTIQKEREENGWHSIWSDENCYFLQKEGESIEKLEMRLPDFTKKYMGEDAAHQAFTIQPFKEIHYDDRFGNYNYNTVSRGMLSILAVIAIFLIVTASINFINLSTAEAIKRSKEVGIRKSLGSTRGQLIAQFLGESGLVTLLALVIALLLAYVGLTFLNPFLDLHLSMNFLSDKVLWFFIVGVALVVAGLSGLYPSFIVSGFNPVAALKNTMGNRNSSGFNLRRILVVIQFSISQFFIIGTIVLITQMNYFQSKELGFDREAILTIPIPVRETPSDDGSSKMKTLRDQLSRINGVQIASLCNTAPSSNSVSGTNFKIEGKEEDFATQVKTVDGNYVDLFGLKMAAGKNIADADTAQGFLVNEKLASIAGYKDPTQIIGKRIKMWGKELQIVGVLKDFHTVSLHQSIEPTVLLNRIRDYRRISVRINPVDMQATIKQVQANWDAAYPEFIFSYEFLDDSIKQFYENEKRTSVLLTLFTSMAIFIGCLGLFGLASFMANQKTKEIGVRKVLGASVESIVLMFSKEYIKLIVIGFLLASPIAWYVMNQWLSDFAYKIEIGPMIFLTGIGLTVLIAMLTVGYRSIKAAITNPVESLRSE